MEFLASYLSQYPIWLLGVIFSLMAGLATGVGALPAWSRYCVSIPGDTPMGARVRSRSNALGDQR